MKQAIYNFLFILSIFTSFTSYSASHSGQVAKINCTVENGQIAGVAAFYIN